MNIELSERQQTTVATAVTVLATLVILCVMAALVWLVAIFLRRFSHVLLPLAVAAVAALVLEPYFEWWKRRLPATLSLGSVFLSILLPVVGLLWFFGDILADQVSDLVSRMPEWWATIQLETQERWPQVVQFWETYGLGARVQEAVAGHEEALLSGLQFVGLKALSAGVGIFGAIGSLFNWALVPIYIAFILLGNLGSVTWSGAALPFLKSETRDDILYLVREFLTIIVAFFRGQLLIALIQGLLFAVGFSVVGLHYGAILGLTLGFLNIIPYLGSILGLGVALPLAFFQEDGGLWTLGAVLVVFTIVQMIEGYLLTPKIMGDQTGLHPMAIMVAIFFWGSALEGIMGMLLAIPLTAFFVVFWRLAREKYIKELV
jgi:predicted PurR-regulated permease PerM